MLTEKAAMYSTLGISKEVFAFGTKIEEELKERFAKIDEIAEYNQLKVIHAMQASKVSEACLYGTTGYGYNDLGRDTLEQVYATCFGTEVHWYARRSPAEPMRLQRRFPEISARATNCFLLLENRTTPLRK